MQDMRNTLTLSKPKGQSPKVRTRLNWFRPELIHRMSSIPNCAGSVLARSTHLPAPLLKSAVRGAAKVLAAQRVKNFVKSE